MFKAALPLLSGLLGLGGCLPTGPTFNNITGITVQKVTADGLVNDELTDTKLQQTAQCLYQTQEVAEAGTEDMLLQETYLIQVKDNAGIRSFELYTRSNLKGNKGRYYTNRCIHKLVERR